MHCIPSTVGVTRSIAGRTATATCRWSRSATTVRRPIRCSRPRSPMIQARLITVTRRGTTCARSGIGFHSQSVPCFGARREQCHGCRSAIACYVLCPIERTFYAVSFVQRPRGVRLVKITDSLAADLGDNQQAGRMGRAGRHGVANVEQAVRRRHRADLRAMASAGADASRTGAFGGCHVRNGDRAWTRLREYQRIYRCSDEPSV